MPTDYTPPTGPGPLAFHLATFAVAFFLGLLIAAGAWGWT